MACGCGCDGCGQSDALLSGLSSPLMSGITDPMHVGAWFRLGVELGAEVYGINYNWPRVAEALNRSGYVQGVQVGKQAGVFHPFILIEGSSAREYGQARHLKDAVLSELAKLHTPDYATVQFEAETYSAETGEPTQTYEGAPINEAGPSGNGAGIFDGIATQLGLPAKEFTWLAIGGGVLLVVMLLKK